MKREPERTCVACRRARPKAELIRMTRRADGEVAVVPIGPGRGAYVCREADCIARLLKPGRLAQAFRRACHPAVDLQDALARAART